MKSQDWENDTHSLACNCLVIKVGTAPVLIASPIK